MSFLDFTKKEQIEFLNQSKISTFVDGDVLETSGKVKDVDLVRSSENEYFIMVTFNIDSLFNEDAIILYNDKFHPLGKMTYSYNEKDAKIAFNYFFVEKSLRGNGLGQSMINLFLEKMEEKFGNDFTIFVNPYTFDISFEGVKYYDTETQLRQYNLEQFYLHNGFLLTEDPRKYTFNDIEYDKDEYILTRKPVEDLFADFLEYERQQENR